MSKESASILRQKFYKNISKKWIKNNHNLTDVSCVYIFISFDPFYDEFDIVYIGSTTKLNSRYKSHKVPEKIQKTGKISLMYYLPMVKGFYDYEIKLIKKLDTVFNKQHKQKWL